MSSNRNSLNELMKCILNIGQVALSEHQYKAFRKMVMDNFANFKKYQFRAGAEIKQNQCEGGGEYE